MHGPPLTPQEAVAAVARQVRRLEALGLDHDQAIRRAAADNGIAPEKARWCAESAAGDPWAAPVETGRGGDQSRPRSERRRYRVHAHAENTARTTPAARRRSPLAPLAVAAATVVAGLLTLASPASAADNAFNVKPGSGKKTDSGSARAR